MKGTEGVARFEYRCGDAAWDYQFPVLLFCQWQHNISRKATGCIKVFYGYRDVLDRLLRFGFMGITMIRRLVRLHVRPDWTWAEVGMEGITLCKVEV